MRALAVSVAVLVGLTGPSFAQEDPSLIEPSGNEAFFRSPTGNIRCAITAGDGTVAVCHLLNISLSPGVFSGACGQSVGFLADYLAGGRTICEDPSFVMGNSRVLEYGRAVTLAGVNCRSAETGVICVNAGGHGFSVARGAQSLF